MFRSYFDESLFRRAREQKILDIAFHGLRDFTTDKHRSVDDKPFGGGPGMVLKLEPIARAVATAEKRKKSAQRRRVILFSTRGKPLDATAARRLAGYDQLVLICGRYEGVDERVARYIADEEISVGPFIMSGGELPAMMLVDAVARYRPGFLGKQESLEELKGSYPVYTKPAEFYPNKNSKKPIWRVPPVLRSGNHAKIEQWRKRADT